MKTLPHIAIVDYGVGNLWSLSKALAQFADVEITEERQRIEKADAIILPGVGTFKAGMDGLAVRGLAEVIKERARAGVREAFTSPYIDTVNSPYDQIPDYNENAPTGSGLFRVR